MVQDEGYYEVRVSLYIPGSNVVLDFLEAFPVTHQSWAQYNLLKTKARFYALLT
jgi:hypothetical protein